MKWLNKHKEGIGSIGKDKVAQGIAGFILKLQQGFASFMTRLTAKMSSATMKVSLIVFLSFGTSLSFYFIVAAFVKETPGKNFKIQRISVPRNLYEDSRVQHGFVITKEEYDEMRKYTDSLRGSKVYDSMMAVRPGLMDSTKELESIYEQNKK